jgi:hypothetical protein
MVEDFTGLKTENLEELVLVPGHGVYIGKKPDHIPLDEHWVGIFPGEGKYYAEHADAGVLKTAELEKALLIFTGGQTRAPAGPRSEAMSYWLLEDQKNWLDNPDVKKQATTEEYARDSFENVQFGIARFKQCTGEYPKHISVCGWGFKKDRFNFHAETLGILDIFTYIGVNEPEGVENVRGFEEKTLEDFRQFPRGDQGVLLEKKLKRDPFLRGNPYTREALRTKAYADSRSFKQL